MLADTLCPDFFPPGQECTLPLYPGQYGSLVGGALDFTLPDLPDDLSKYLTMRRLFLKANWYTVNAHKGTITINVPVVSMAQYIMVLRRATSLLVALEGVGPENRDFLGPEMATSEASAIWAQKS